MVCILIDHFMFFFTTIIYNYARDRKFCQRVDNSSLEREKHIFWLNKIHHWEMKLFWFLICMFWFLCPNRENLSLKWKIRSHHYQWRAANFVLNSNSLLLSNEGSLACHTYCDTGRPFIMVISEDPWLSHLLPSV